MTPRTAVILDRSSTTPLSLFLISYTAAWFEAGETVLARVAVIAADVESAKTLAGAWVRDELHSVYGFVQLDADVDTLDLISTHTPLTILGDRFIPQLETDHEQRAPQADQRDPRDGPTDQGRAGGA